MHRNRCATSDHHTLDWREGPSLLEFEGAPLVAIVFAAGEAPVKAGEVRMVYQVAQEGS